MKRKRSEESLRKMANHYGFKALKGRDRGYVNCPTCHKNIRYCPMCKGDMLLPKAKGKLDFTVMFDWTEIECKQGEESWALNDFTEAQEALMKKHMEEFDIPRWIFLEIGTGRAPKGKEAYLIPVDGFMTIRKMRYAEKAKSVRFRSTGRSRVPEARQVFYRFRLIWEPNVGWTIPEDHEFWRMKKIIKREHDEQRPTATPTRLTMLG